MPTHGWCSLVVFIFSSHSPNFSHTSIQVLGSAIALNILFHCPLPLGVLLTGGDVLVLLAFRGRSAVALEAIVLVLVGLIFFALCFALGKARAPPAAVLRGLLPTSRLVTDPGCLFNGVAILGATVSAWRGSTLDFFVTFFSLGCTDNPRRS